MISMRRTTQEDFDAAAANALPVYAGENPERDQNMVTIHTQGTILGVVSVTALWSGTIWLNAVLTPDIYKHPLAFVRFCIKELCSVHVRSGVHRIQIDVRSDYEAGHKFARALGFKPEGIMKMFGPNKEDYTLYARTSW